MNKEIENYYDKFSEKYDETAKISECNAQFYDEAKKYFRSIIIKQGVS